VTPNADRDLEAVSDAFEADRPGVRFVLITCITNLNGPSGSWDAETPMTVAASTVIHIHV
jgi:hypothetical protein